MALTNFAALLPTQKIVWERDLWKEATDQMFMKKFMGMQNSPIHRFNKLTKTERGDAAVFYLRANLVKDGGRGDNEREGNEEAIQAYEQRINIDLLWHGVTNTGKLADQQSVVDFREEAKDALAQWLADRCDQMAILTASGISYAYENTGATRVDSILPTMRFAADVSAPTAKRGLMWDGTNLLPSSTGSITSSFTASYRMIVKLHAYAKAHRVKPLRSGGKDYYLLLVSPATLAQLKLDQDFQRAVVGVATKQGDQSPWFTGGTVTVDGLVIHEHNLVFNTSGASAGSKWGAGGNIDGTRAVLMGAQALGFCDLGAPTWEEEKFQYKSRVGINVDKMLGFLKPKFYSTYDRSVEDFSVVTVDMFYG